MKLARIVWHARGNKKCIYSFGWDKPKVEQRGRIRQNWRRAKGNLGKMRGVNRWHEFNLTRTKFNSEVL